MSDPDLPPGQYYFPDWLAKIIGTPRELYARPLLPVREYPTTLACRQWAMRHRNLAGHHRVNLEWVIAWQEKDKQRRSIEDEWLTTWDLTDMEYWPLGREYAITRNWKTWGWDLSEDIGTGFLAVFAKKEKAKEVALGESIEQRLIELKPWRTRTWEKGSAL